MARATNTNRGRPAGWFGDLLSGLAGLVSLYPPARPPRYPHRDEGEALQGDGWRVGDDFRRVLGSLPPPPEAGERKGRGDRR